MHRGPRAETSVPVAGFRIGILGNALLMLFAWACTAPGENTNQVPPTASAAAAPQLATSGLWIAPSVPDELRTLAQKSNLPPAADAASAIVILGPADSDAQDAIEWIFALVAPFPTVLDDVSSDQLRAVWTGESSAEYGDWPLLVSASTRAALENEWGAAGAQVMVKDAPELLEAAWAGRPSWAIVPFEALEPQWKVLTVDGQSPVRKDFEPGQYELTLRFALSGQGAAPALASLPPSNRDPSKLTTVLMSGTSGLAREIAYQMETKGLTYPARDIGSWLREADLFHISNEVSFDPACPPPNPLKSKFTCSNPAYIALFDDVGLDLVELTGNHIMDNGAAAMLYSLGLYREHGITYFGGGANLEEARRPALVEHNGNRIAFLGCNFAEPPQPIAGQNLPGANPCDWKLLAQQVEALHGEGYLPIVTFQYKEGYSPVVMPWQSIDFRRAADAGAIVVSGSQSHVPMQMEFYGGAFIHYGLGNLFFGQMANQPPGPGLPLQPAQRYEFLDRHILYDGRHISTELLTAMLEEYSRPRPMTSAERARTLEAYFAYSGWLQFVPTPAPAQTPTLYPLLKFVPLPTYTPTPKVTVPP